MLINIRSNTAIYKLSSKNIGEGSHGTVRGGMDLNTRHIFAVKSVDVNRSRSRRLGAPMAQPAVEQEIKIMRTLNHRNVMMLRDVVRSETGVVHMVMDMGASSVQNVLDVSGRGLSEAQVCYIVHQALLGLQHMHERGVAHRDVKPANVLLARDGTVKLSDFGVSEFLPNFPVDDIVTRTVGTPVFHAPEIARGDDAFSGTKLDVWALGVTTYMLLSGRPPFRFTGCAILPLYRNILSGEYTEIDEVSNACQNVISRMLEPSAGQRPSVGDLLHDKWFEGRCSAEECARWFESFESLGIKEVRTELEKYGGIFPALADHGTASDLPQSGVVGQLRGRRRYLLPFKFLGRFVRSVFRILFFRF